MRGFAYGGWLFVRTLWVQEARRGNGLGSALLAAIENRAIRCGCRRAHLDTFSFQARGFYEKHGYELFGQLDDYPVGHQRFFLQKRLVPPLPA